MHTVRRKELSWAKSSASDSAFGGLKFSLRMVSVMSRRVIRSLEIAFVFLAPIHV